MPTGTITSAPGEVSVKATDMLADTTVDMDALTPEGRVFGRPECPHPSAGSVMLNGIGMLMIVMPVEENGQTAGDMG